jgi:hypothetical protein
MLPDLLREAFGSDLSNSQETLSVVTPELLASFSSDDSTGVGEVSGTLPGVDAEPPPPTRLSWQRAFGILGAATATAILVGLLVGRGGGARSQAREGQPPVPAAHAVVPPPAVEPPPPAPAAETAPVAAPSEPAAAAPAEPAEAESENRRHSSRSHRHHSSHKQAGQEDRVVRGLSIDPFAEAARGSKP